MLSHAVMHAIWLSWLDQDVCQTWTEVSLSDRVLGHRGSGEPRIAGGAVKEAALLDHSVRPEQESLGGK